MAFDALLQNVQTGPPLMLNLNGLKNWTAPRLTTSAIVVCLFNLSLLLAAT
jgi:hypothetical protein